MSYRFRTGILLVFFLLSVVSLYHVNQLTFTFSLEQFFPEGDEDLAFYKEFEKNFEQDVNFLLVALLTKHIYIVTIIGIPMLKVIPEIETNTLNREKDISKKIIVYRFKLIGNKEIPPIELKDLSLSQIKSFLTEPDPANWPIEIFHLRRYIKSDE